MLPKRLRLSLKTDFARVQKKGRLFQGKIFSLLLSKKEKPGPSRFGFIISTKIHKKATKRNRARRLLIEAVQNQLPQIKSGFDCVFLAKKSIIGKELTEIKKETEKIFRLANLKT